MKRIQFLSIIFFLLSSGVHAQELFPNTEPASTVPKGVIGLRMMSETYNESGTLRNQFSARVMYGLTARLTLWAQPMVSNHHGQTFPSDLINHSHVTGITFAQQVGYGKKYKYSFAGVHLYAKYRFLNFDQDDSHFRVAWYGEFTPIGRQAHDEAEAHLQGDTGGWGSGLILTYLKSRFAASFTGGFIVPQSFEDVISNDRYRLEYGNAITYALSFGYLIYPKNYESYSQNNYNLYIELMGKSYSAVELTWFDIPVDVRTDALLGGQYLDAYLGIQRIVNSNDRIELSVGIPVYKKSYRHFYPLLNLTWQRYFY